MTPFSKIKVMGSKVVVRPYKLSDFKPCREAHANRLPKVNEFDGEINASKDSTAAQFKRRIERHRRIAKDGHQFIFGIFDVGSGEHVGQVDIMTLNKQLRWGNLGYLIHNQHWSKGYATEASRITLRIAFRELNFHRMEAATEPKNKASIKVAGKIGMRFEGERKKFFPDNGGVDMLVYGTNAIDFVYQ